MALGSRSARSYATADALTTGGASGDRWPRGRCPGQRDRLSMWRPSQMEGRAMPDAPAETLPEKPARAVLHPCRNESFPRPGVERASGSRLSETRRAPTSAWSLPSAARCSCRADGFGRGGLTLGLFGSGPRRTRRSALAGAPGAHRPRQARHGVAALPRLRLGAADLRDRSGLLAAYRRHDRGRGVPLDRAADPPPSGPWRAGARAVLWRGGGGRDRPRRVFPRRDGARRAGPPRPALAPAGVCR